MRTVYDKLNKVKAMFNILLLLFTLLFILINLEGFERRSRKEYLNFLNIAKGSAGELRSLLRVALEVGYIEQSTYSPLNNQAMELSRMLFNQIQSINRASSA